MGDFTLFMTGIFRGRVERTTSTGYYVNEGKRAVASARRAGGG